MKTAEKLTLRKEMEARNEESCRQHAKTCAIHNAIEVSARAILDGLDILAQHYGVERPELLELLVNTLWAQEQTKAQEG